MERVLVIAAHPDDEVLGCGGTIAKLRSGGVEVRVVFLAEGITARFLPNEFELSEVQSKIKRRHENGLRAMAFLGLEHKDIFFGERYCCRLDTVPQIDLVKEIEGHVKDFAPTTIYTHAAYDTNVDHRCAHQAVLTAMRPLGNLGQVSIYAFEILSSTEWNTVHPFAPTAFVDVTDSIEAKVAAMKAYEDEMQPSPHPRSAEVIEGLATYRGTQVGVRYAEGFQLIRSLS
ncbi:PIG-L deacetylase family protein [Thalassospira povalilytica]|uniref:PIG-L deacetylase family protein n=1 Tax=Thalassospira povalilytica TaxID=732237 RepID=UPI003AA89226